MIKTRSRSTVLLLAVFLLCFLLSPAALAAEGNGEYKIYQACPRPAITECKPTKPAASYNPAASCKPADTTKAANDCIPVTKNNSSKQQSTCPVQVVKPAQTTKPSQNTQTQPNNTANTPAKSSYATEVVRLVNEERAKQNLAPLTMDTSLTAAAQTRAQEIRQSFSHTRPNGKSCFSVLAEAGISYRRAGENIAMGQSTPAQVVKAWMDSPGHRANILGDYTKIGVGVLEGSGNYGGLAWAQFFTK